MHLGKIQRDILLRAYVAEGWELAFVPNRAAAEREVIHRAVYALVDRGLVEAELRVHPLYIPRKPRLQVRLTAEGRTFCSVFSTPLQTGSRIRASTYRKATGGLLPFMRENTSPWLNAGRQSAAG